MTLQISIIVPADEVEPAKYLALQMAALGFYRQHVVAQTAPVVEASTAEMIDAVADRLMTQADGVAEAAQSATSSTVKRERGKPCPLSGRKRRTREEVEEDEAAEAAKQATAGAPTIAHHVALPDDASPTDVAQAFAGLSGQQISTGEERIDPAAEPEQPAADIFAEPEPAATLEDVKKALGAYVTAFGMVPAQEDGQRIFREVLGGPPAGEQAWRMTLIPNDGSKYGAVVAAITAAIELNPYKRERVA